MTADIASVATETALAPGSCCRSASASVGAAVGEDRAPVQQAPEPAFAVVAGIPAEVFGAHRAYDDVDDQAGACRRGFECRQGGYGE